MAVPLEQINIDSPSAVVRDALQRAMEAEAPTGRAGNLAPSELVKAKRGVQRGIQDLDEGRYTDFSESGLRASFADTKIRNAKRLSSLATKPVKP